MSSETDQPIEEQDTRKVALNKRWEEISWALFLIMVGGIWLVPIGTLPESTWLFGVGLILLGLNAIRCVNGIRVSRFSLFLGILAVLLAAGDFLGAELPLFPILLIIIGLNIIISQFIEKERA